MRRLRWTRVEAGVYTYGNWTVQGKGTRWELLRADEDRPREDGAVVRRARSKGELQQWVADDANEPAAELAHEPEPEPEPEPTRRRVTVAPTTSLESVIASLRLELEQLTLAVRTLAAEVATLAERGRKV